MLRVSGNMFALTIAPAQGVATLPLLQNDLDKPSVDISLLLRLSSHSRGARYYRWDFYSLLHHGFFADQRQIR
jgi:hypothetical protein